MCTALLATLIAAGPLALNVTVGAGGALSESDVVAPVLSAGVGYDLGQIEFGVRFVGVIGPEGADHVGGGGNFLRNVSANRAVSWLVDIKVHPSELTPIQPVLGIGVGIGHLIRAQVNQDEHFSMEGHAAPAFQISLGGRTSAISPHLLIGLELALMVWTGAEHGANPDGTQAQHVPESGLVVEGAALSLTLSFLP